MKRTALFVIVFLLLVGGGSLLFRQPKSARPISNSNNVKGAVTMEKAGATDQLSQLAERPIVTIETNLGTFKVKLYTSAAPELTKNFIELSQSGYYNGLTFHRVIPGFVIQGGDPKGDGTGGHSYKGEGAGLADEAGALKLKHVRGAVAWAKSSLPNSIGSQFYVALDDLTQLDGGYSVFGQVVEGMEVVDKLAAVPTDASDRPLTPVTMTRVTVAE
jgi:peptidyl-prolyl cis-trans isomerase B (cyclophilin B)